MSEPRSILGDFRGLARIWPYLRPWRRNIVIAGCLVPFIFLVHVSIPYLLKIGIDEGVVAANPRYILLGALGYFLLVVVEYFLRVSQTLLMATSVHRMIRRLRRAMINHVLRLSSRYHDRSLSGALVTRATSDFDNLSESLNQGLLNSLVDVAVVLGALGGLFFLNWQLALIVLFFMPFIVGFVTFYSSALKRAMLKARMKIASLNAFTQEALFGLQTIKTLGGEDEAVAEVEEKALEFRNAQMKSVVLDAMMFALLDGMAAMTVGFILYLAVSEFFGVMDSLSPGVVIAFVAYVGQLFEPLKQLGSKMAMMQGAFTAIERIFGVLETKDFVGGDEPIEHVAGELFVDRLSYRYQKDGPYVLKNVSFQVASGESLAIVGPTGSGKSTIIRLLAKLYDGYEGEILLDGKDLARLAPESLRQHLAIVPQDIVLFEGSVSFNISLGLPGITEDDIIQALQAVGAYEFFRSLPGGLRYEISSGGENLSQGQKQLIAFARALAKKPKLIILDEATASIDPTSEALIQKATETLCKGHTVIIIAHRLKTIERCDHILVMRHGEVEEWGNHRQLIEKNGLYASMQKELRG